eukprot:3645170-Rhodomonas_salina.1
MPSGPCVCAVLRVCVHVFGAERAICLCGAERGVCVWWGQAGAGAAPRATQPHSLPSVDAVLRYAR